MGFFKSLISVVIPENKAGASFKFDDNHTVYFKGKGVTETDAARTADFFKGYGYFTETNQSDVQIFSADMKDAVNIGFIAGGRSVSEDTELFFL